MDKNKDFRKLMGFTNKVKLKSYYQAKDIISVNWALVEKYNERLKEIFEKINEIIFVEYKLSTDEMNAFNLDFDNTYQKLRRFRFIEDRFTNNGRAREAVYYNWMRGYLVTNYFSKIISLIFSVEESDIEQLGKDNLAIINSDGDKCLFKKEAIADLKIDSLNIHIEVQAGFSDQNDIKKSKAQDAVAKHNNDGCTTYIIHFDLYNGRVAVIDITALMSNPSVEWTKNGQFEGVETTKIPDDKFLWRITEQLPDTVITEL